MTKLCDCKLFFSFFLILFLCSFGVSASSNYPNIGGSDYNFASQDVSFWNENMITDSFSTRNVGTPRGSPLVSDLDGDGENEIIVLDDDIITLYRDKELFNAVGISGYTLESQISGNYYSNMIVFDVDGDGLKEIIVVQEHNQNLSLINYNGTHTFLKASFDLTGSGQSLDGGFPERSGTCMIGCGDVESCLIVCTTKNRFIAGNSVYASAFNSSHGIRQTGTVLVTSGGSTGEGFFPKTPVISYKDFDFDGVSEFIFSYYFEIAGVDQDYISAVSINSSGHVLEDLSASWSNIFFVNLDADPDRLGFPYLSSPLVTDFKSASSGLEILVGYQESENNFLLTALKSTGSELATYPSIQDTDGEIISNPFLANAFDDTGNVDVCLAGFDDDERLIDVLCASAETSGLSNNEFFFDMDEDLFNISINNDLSITQSQSVETKQTNGLSEVLLPYGVFELDLDSCNILGLCDLDLIYSNPIGVGGSIISIDSELSGRDDLLLLTETNLYYIDDGFSNSNAFVDGLLTFTPCAISQAIKQNETLRVSFKVSDVDGDNVNATVTIYDNEIDEETQSQSGISGTTFSFDFILRNLTSSSNVTISVKDNVNTGSQVLNYSYSVTISGVTFESGCKDSFVFGSVDGEVDSAIDDTDITQSDIEAIREAVAPSSSISPQYRALWGVLILFVIGIGILGSLIKDGGVKDPNVLIIVTLTFVLIAWIFLVFLKIIPGWTLFVGILFGSVLLGFKFKDRISRVVMNG